MDKNIDKVFDLITEEHIRQTDGIELIASENYVSENVLKALGSCLTNKYAEGYPGHRYYGGCHVVDEVETLCQNLAKQLFNATYANVQPHSGSQANMAVYQACLNPGDTVIGLELSHGGHLTHGSPVSFSGSTYNFIPYHVDKETSLVDYDEMGRLAEFHKPKLIMGGASAYSREWDYKRMREIADSVGAVLVIDMAHTAGLIAARLLNNPLDYAHIVTSTTHKTLRGPRGGLILLRSDFPNPKGKTDKSGNILPMSKVIDLALFPGIQGGPLEHVIAAKAVAFAEALQPEFRAYQEQVIKNAKAMASAFKELGYSVVSDGTDNHCILLDLRSKFPGLTGKEAEKVLESMNISVNKNMVPYDTRSPFQTSGIRIGTPAVTSRGFTEYDCIEVAGMINYFLSKAANNQEFNEDDKNYVLDFLDKNFIHIKAPAY